MIQGRPKTAAEQRSRASALRTAIADQQASLGFGTERLARESRIHRRTLDKYFEGDSPNPSFFLIAALAQVLGLSLDELAEVRPDE